MRYVARYGTSCSAIARSTSCERLPRCVHVDAHRRSRHSRRRLAPVDRQPAERPQRGGASASPAARASSGRRRKQSGRASRSERSTVRPASGSQRTSTRTRRRTTTNCPTTGCPRPGGARSRSAGADPRDPSLPRGTSAAYDGARERQPVEVSMSEKMGRRAVLGARLRVGSRLGRDGASEGAPRAPHRALREGDARERQALGRRAALPPRRNLELLGEHGFLGLTVPEEYGGLGENHVAFAMACETIARYGCASTAMCYVMHIGAVMAVMYRPTEELVEKYIRPLRSGKIGTLSYSDLDRIGTSGTRSPRAERSNGGYKVRKKACGPPLRDSRTSTSCRRRARTSRGTTTSPCG